MIILTVIGINKESLLGYIKANAKRKETSATIPSMPIYSWNTPNSCDGTFIHQNNYFLKICYNMHDKQVNV